MITSDGHVPLVQALSINYYGKGKVYACDEDSTDEGLDILRAICLDPIDVGNTEFSVPYDVALDENSDDVQRIITREKRLTVTV